MWRGRRTFPTPMLWAVGFLFTFLFGLTGVLPRRRRSTSRSRTRTTSSRATPRQHLRDVGGDHAFWFLKVTGRRLDERLLGKTHFWLWSIGFVLTFLPRRTQRPGCHTTAADPSGRTPLDGAERALDDRRADHRGVGAGVPRRGRGALRRPRDMPADPWEANSLEWATSSPPPHLLPVRSVRPLRAAGFDARVGGLIDDPRAPDEGATPGLAVDRPPADARRPPRPARRPAHRDPLLRFLGVFGLVLAVIYWFVGL